MTHTLLLLAATALPLVLAACGQPEAAPAPLRSVLVQAAAPAGAAGLALSGEIRARHEADLAFRVGGKVAARLVDGGAVVKAGTPLARLDPADLALALAAARAQVAAAESEAATAGADRERYADLLVRKFVSQAAFDAKDNAFRTARARLDQARAQAAVSGNQTGYGTLAADRDGVITAVLADPGQVVAAGQPVLRLARPEEKEVAVAVPEGRVAEVKAAREFAVSLWTRPDLALRGQLRELAAAADPATRTYAARIRLIDPPPEARLGMTARVALAGAAAAPILVPLGAVVDQGQGPAVWVVADNRAQPRPVQVARFREEGAEIAAGLAAGELVVVAGSLKLAPGQPVSPQPAVPPARQK